MLLLLLPSAVLTNNIAVGLPEFINVWLWRIPVFLLSPCVFVIRKHYLQCLPYFCGFWYR